jgi:Uncharacterized protein conserved in bacteria
MLRSVHVGCSGLLVITADFREIEFEDGPRRCEGLFRAAIAEFSEKPRPSREEIAQIDDLALGLYDSVSREARHYAATVLSRSKDVPPGLFQRLCNEPVDISAPLLVNSPLLTTIDLLRLISRHGLSHARIIVRRRNVDPVIVNLVRLLNAKAESEAASRREVAASPLLEQVRDRLRALASGSTQQEPEPEAEEAPQAPSGLYMDLLRAALSSNADAFPRALAGALDLTVVRARRICSAITYSDLIACLKYLHLRPEEAFLLTAAYYPSQLFYGPAIRLFLDRYETLRIDDVELRLEEWRTQDEAAQAAALQRQSAAISM